MESTSLSGTILVVDDYEYNREVASRWLKRQGFQVLEAENGRIALEILKTERVDLVLLDIMMPEMNGYQTLENLASEIKLGRLSVIVISASDDMESVAKCIEMGAEDYLFKPFNRVLLKARINAVLEKKQLRSQDEHFRQQITRMQKLADLGTMASGVAHEMNSPLQVIIGLSESLVKRLQHESMDQEYLSSRIDTIRRNAWRCAEIANSLRTYAQAPVFKLERADFNLLIREAIQLVENRLQGGDKITITTELEPDLPPIACSAQMITEALSHLLNNALDAVNLQGGAIRVQSIYQKESQLFQVFVSDSGKGIPQEIHERVFDPFFTTKPMGEGTGLGLSIVQGIIRSHGGNVEISTTSPKGTTFLVTLPQSPPPAENQNQQNENESGRFDDFGRQL